MKSKFKILIVFFGLMVFGCLKNKPAPGRYSCFFTFTYPEQKEWWRILEITEATSEYIIIKGMKLQKKGKHISGMYFDDEDFAIYRIDGELSHKAFSKKVTLKGTFIRTVYDYHYPIDHQPFDQLPSSNGTFVMKDFY